MNPTSQPKHLSLMLCATFVAFSHAAPADAASGSATVKLWPTAVVIDDVIRLEDVAELRGFDPDTMDSLKELVLATAPKAGGSRIVSLSAVRDGLSQFGINRARVIVKGSAECAVRRPTRIARPVRETPPPDATGTDQASKPPNGGTLREAVVAYFDRQLTAYGGRCDISFGRTAEQVLDLSGGEFEFRIRRMTGATLGLINLEITILREQAEVQRVPMVASVAMIRNVVVARKAINRGATVTPEHVHVESRRFTRTEGIGAANLGEVIGLRARRFVPLGELVEARDLERVPLVRRGQVVEVISRFGAVSVRTAAKVREEGGYGEMVTLQLPRQGRTQIVGRVVGPQRVEVGEWEIASVPGTMLAAGGER